MSELVPAGPDYPIIHSPSDLITEYLQARAERDRAQARVDQLGSQIIEEMELNQRKSFRWNGDGLTRALTYVVKRVPVVDEAGLRKALTAKVYDHYTKRVLDRKAMEAAMDSGEVDPITVSKYVTDKLSRPYLEYREKPENIPS